jgi:hypothetical protein
VTPVRYARTTISTGSGRHSMARHVRVEHVDHVVRREVAGLLEPVGGELVQHLALERIVPSTTSKALRRSDTTRMRWPPRL